MRAMTAYLAEHLPIIEYLIEEFRLSVKDMAVELGDSLDLYHLDESVVREKLAMLGLEVDFLEESWQPTAMFYKLYKRLIRNRSTTGSVQTLAHTGGQLEALYRTIEAVQYYRNLHVYRDYQAPHIMGRDGYFYMVYDPKYPLSGNALISKMLPAGYCFMSVTEFYGFDSSEVLKYGELIDDGTVYISDFPDGADNPCDLIDEGHVFERLRADNIKGIMPQHDQGWSFGGLAVRDKTFGDLFRERDVRTQPMNKSWTELLNHHGTGKYNTLQHIEHAFIMNRRDDGLIITDSIQYHKDLIISERQEFDIIHEGISVFSVYPQVNVTIPVMVQIPHGVSNLGVFGGTDFESKDIISMKTLAGYSTDEEMSDIADFMCPVCSVTVSVSSEP